MRFLWKYLSEYQNRVAAVMGIKLAGTLTELLIPYALEHMIDKVVPMQRVPLKPQIPELQMKTFLPP